MPKVVFLVMSAQQPSATVEQLIDSLAPHRVVVHHDFGKLADFRLASNRATLVPQHRDTGWGTWGFCDAILHSLAHCLERHDFDYLQLLSPTSLPIRPLAEFEAQVADGRFDAHADLIDLTEDVDAWMTYAARAYPPARSLRQRAGRRLARWYFGPNPEPASVKSMVVLRPRNREGFGTQVLRRWPPLALTKLLVAGMASRHPYAAKLRPTVGSTWFGASRDVCAFLVEQGRDRGIGGFFSTLSNADEHFFPTMLRNSPYRVGPSNHSVSPFDKAGHPRRIDVDELARSLRSGRYFARKFADDPADAVRFQAIATARGFKGANAA